MGQILQGSATTTEAVRRTIQLRQESVRALAKRYHYDTHDQLRTHLQIFVGAYDYEGLRPCEASHPMSTSATPGRKSPNGPGSTRHITSRDHTPSPDLT